MNDKEILAKKPWDYDTFYTKNILKFMAAARADERRRCIQTALGYFNDGSTPQNRTEILVNSTRRGIARAIQDLPKKEGE